MASRLNDLSGKEWLQSSFSIWRDLKRTVDEKRLNHPASFPMALTDKIINIFTHSGDKIIDPFLGSGTTLLSAVRLGRECVGIDLSDEYCKLSEKRAKEIGGKYKINHGDSIEVLKKYAGKDFDLCVTSPPYWDILNMQRTADYKKKKNYSKKTTDLGNVPEYDEFMKLLSDVFWGVYQALKTDGYCVVNVMDIRKKDKFYPFHMDIINSLREVGFYLDDIIIWDRQHEYNNMKPLGFPYKFRVNKVHEYVLIFTKREEK